MIVKLYGRLAKQCYMNYLLLLLLLLKMLMMRKIYDLLYLYKAHLIEVNLNLGGLITIDAR